MNDLKTVGYSVMRLHHHSENAWAVIDSRTGAIATEGAKLMMRLSHPEALRLAERASLVARFLSTVARADDRLAS